jgi:integrase
MAVGCNIKRNANGNLAYRLFFNGLRSWEGIRGLKDTPENRAHLQDRAKVISREIKDRSFVYLRWFPDGNLAHLFKRDESPSPSHLTLQAYFKTWIEAQKLSGRPHRIKDYYAAIDGHCLTARVGSMRFGKIALGLLGISELKELQSKLKAKGLKARSVNSIIHSCLRAMIRDARIAGHVTANLFDKDLFKPLPLTDSESSIDPFEPDEREAILEAFRTKKPQFYPFVFFDFWQGPRPSESTALRWGDIDLRHSSARISKSRVQGNEGGTKTHRSNREIHLHENVVEVLKSLKPLHVKPEDYVFTTPSGTPIDVNNFYHREWLPILRAKNIRPRPFYNCRHTYCSFLYSIGASSGFISKQSGDSIKTLEADYAKYIEQADSRRDFVEAEIRKSATHVQPPSPDTEKTAEPEMKKPLGNQGLKSGAGDRGRTDDLMLGKHTL